MSLFGSLASGVSGLRAQSSAMGAIADNVANVNTTGYKQTQVQFNTLVTKQVSTTQYSPGGVQAAPQQGVDVQGLLSSSTSSTDLAISGQGFFVVNEAANPGDGDMFGYSRAGSFRTDDDGYLVNTGGFYLQAWSILPHDGNQNAPVVNIGDDAYMRAYNDEKGNTTYVNANIVDSKNLRPVNLNEVGGTANQTQNIRLGANLPAGDPIYDPNNPNAGGSQQTAVLVYDSLGNSHNMSLNWFKAAENAWDVETQVPSGAATLVTYGNAGSPLYTSTQPSPPDNSDPTIQDVYSAQGQLEFNEIPADASRIIIDDVIFEFDRDGGNGSTYDHQIVDLSTATSTADAVAALKTAINRSALVGTDRFQQDGTRLVISQSPSGPAVAIDAGECEACQQSNANPDPVTQVPTGQFTVPAIDPEYTDVARLDFAATSTPTIFTTANPDHRYGITVTTDKGGTNESITHLRFYATDEMDPLNNTTTTPVALNHTAVASWTKVRFSTANNTIMFGTANVTTATTGNLANLANLVPGDRITFAGNAGQTGTFTITQVDAAKGSIKVEETITTNTTVTTTGAAGTATFALTYDGIGTATDATTGDYIVGVDMTSIGNTLNNGADMVTNIVNAIQTNSQIPMTDRFEASGRSLVFNQSAKGSTVEMDWSNPGGATTDQGLVFTNYRATSGVQATDGLVFRAGNITFNNSPRTIDDTLTLRGGADSDLDDLKVGDSFVVSGTGVGALDVTYTIRSVTVGPTTTAVPTAAQLSTGDVRLVLNTMAATTTSMATGTAATAGGGTGVAFQFQPENDSVVYNSNPTEQGGTTTQVVDSTEGDKKYGIRFNSDGTPEAIRLDQIEIEWANGATNMEDAPNIDPEKDYRVDLFLGNLNTTSGMTQFAGDYSLNYVTQDGAMFGNFAGVQVSEEGVVTALFDNGETLPVAQIPVATFVNPNGLESLTGNAWIATDFSGAVTLRTAGTGGAGTVQAAVLENSTVDLGEEFTDMIVTQRAYSAAAKVIGTSDEMLDELMRVKR